jgi:hypothetical protein
MWELSLIEFLYLLFLAFHSYSFIENYIFKVFIKYVICLYAFWNGVGPHISEWLRFCLTSFGFWMWQFNSNVPVSVAPGDDLRGRRA